MNSFSRAFLLVLLSVLVLLSGFSLLMDPYALFDTPRLDGVNRFKPVGLRHIRLSKAYRVAGEDHDALILGSSRTGRGLSCAMLRDPTVRCYNASSTAATPLESLRYLQQQTPDSVYLGLDLFTIVETPLINESFVDDRLKLDRDGDLNLRYYRQWISDHFGALISWQALGDGRLTFRSQGKVMFMPTSDGMPYIRSDGSWGEDPSRLKERPNNARGRNQEKRFMHIYRVMALMFNKTLEQHRAEGLSLTGTMETHLQSLREIIAFCHENDIRLTLFFNASHAYYWQLAYSEMGKQVLDYWKRRVLNINSSVAGQFGRQPYPLHDFSGINEIGSEEIPSAANGHRFAESFQDPMHYSPAVGQRMLDQMAKGCDGQPGDSWGPCLYPENLDVHLREQWRRHTAFSRQHAAAIDRFRKRVMAQSTKGN